MFLVNFSKKTTDYKSGEGKDDVKSSCPLCSGLHTCYNGYNNKLQFCENELIFKYTLSSDYRLKLAYMKMESLVIASQLYCGEFVLGPCTHRPSHQGNWFYLKILFNLWMKVFRIELVTRVKS